MTDRLVYEGEVACPLKRRDVSVEECWHCRWLDAYAEGPPVVRCAPDVKRPIDLAPFLPPPRS